MPDSSRAETDRRPKLKLVYFDTSSWNGLTQDRCQELLVDRIQQQGIRVMVSVILAGEVLRTPDLEKRKLLCSTMLALHGDGPLFDHPLSLARAAAEASLRGEQDVLLPETPPCKVLRASLSDPVSAPTAEIRDWLFNLDRNMQRFHEQVKPAQSDLTTEYLSPEILSRQDFLEILCQFPPARELGISLSVMRDICQRSDIWKALAATLACIISLSTTHSPKRRNGRKRPGGPDLWQAVYLGAGVEIFVTSDNWMLEVVSKISKLFPYPRLTMQTRDFLQGLGH